MLLHGRVAVTFTAASLSANVAKLPDLLGSGLECNKQKDARFEIDVGKLNPLLTVCRLIEVASAEVL